MPTASPALQARLRSRIQRRGVRRTAEDLRVDKRMVISALAGIPQMAGSLALLEKRLDEIDRIELGALARASKVLP